MNFHKQKEVVITFSHIVKIEKRVHFPTTGTICRERYQESQRETILNKFVSSYGNASVHELLLAVGDCKLWGRMVSHARRQDT